MRKNKKQKPLHHGATETRRKTKNKWVLFGPSDRCGFIESRISIFRTCRLHQKDEGTEYNQERFVVDRTQSDRDLESRRKRSIIVTTPKNLCFLRFLCVSRF